MTDCVGGGVQRFIRVALQSDYETEGTTFRYQGLAQNADDTITQEIFESRGLENVNATQNSSGVRTSTTSASFEYQVARVLELVFGTPTHAETTGDWVHTFNVNTVPPYMTVVVGSDVDSVAAAKHTGHLVDTATLGWELNGNVTVDISTLGQFSEGITTKPSHTVPTTPVLTYKDCSATINSTTIKRVQSASVTFTHQLEAVSGSESQDPSCHVFLGRTVEFTINAGMNTNEFRTAVKNDTVNTVSLTSNNGVTLGSGKRGWDADLGGIVVTSLEEAGAVAGITLFTISGTAIITGLTATDGIANTDW